MYCNANGAKINNNQDTSGNHERMISMTHAFMVPFADAAGAAAE